jgi:hypothetical protein
LHHPQPHYRLRGQVVQRGEKIRLGHLRAEVAPPREIPEPAVNRQARQIRRAEFQVGQLPGELGVPLGGHGKPERVLVVDGDTVRGRGEPVDEVGQERQHPDHALTRTMPEPRR